MFGSLIPFGEDAETGMLVDVGSVPKGRACGCICPSCKTPLVARQGNINEWHFAHRSQNVHEKTQTACSFSFFVSVRLMIRQISQHGLSIKLPKLSMSFPVVDSETDELCEEDLEVTPESIKSLTNVEVGEAFSGTVVDAIGQIDSVPLVIYVSYKGRAVPSELFEPRVPLCGVLEVKADALWAFMMKGEKGHYIGSLKQYLETQTSGKRWVYHPRYSRLKAQAESIYEQFSQRRRRQFNEPGIRYTGGRSAPRMPMFSAPRELPKKNYVCVMCHESWYSDSHVCPKCETHLFTRES